MNFDWRAFAKMYATDYDTTPFYFTQTSPQGKVRIACWSPDPHLTWSVANEVIAEFPDEISVLLKIEMRDEGTDDPWDRFHRAGINKQLVIDKISEYEDYVLGDASNEIAVRRRDSGEYLAYDRAGVLWLYPEDDGKRWCSELEARGFRLEYRTLISDVFHWNRRAEDSDAQREAFILDLGLEPAEKAYQ
jgi:hypothetical protein